MKVHKLQLLIGKHYCLFEAKTRIYAYIRVKVCPDTNSRLQEVLHVGKLLDIIY
jgi:hypothetical protein